MNPGVRKALDERLLKGMLEADELTELAEATSVFPWSKYEGSFALEIGTYKGHTAVMMAKSIIAMGHAARVIVIDAFERAQSEPLNKPGSYQKTMENILAAGLGHNCLVISACSDDAAHLIPARVGALVIDGYHSYEQATRDLENYIPKLLPGGFCLVDDYCDFYPGVIQAVDEFLLRAPGVVLEQKLRKGVALRKI